MANEVAVVENGNGKSGLAPTPRYTIDITKAKKAHLRFLAKEGDKDRWSGFFTQLSHDSMEVFKIMAADEIVRFISATVAIILLWKAQVLDDVTAGTLWAAVVAKAGFDIMNPFN